MKQRQASAPAKTIPLPKLSASMLLAVSKPMFSVLSAAFAAAFLVACELNPASSESDGAETSARQAAPHNAAAPQCIRVQSAAAADSVWYCPDPRPPAPAGFP